MDRIQRANSLKPRALAFALVTGALTIGAAPSLGAAYVASGTFENVPSVGLARAGRFAIPDVRAEATLDSARSSRVRGDSQDRLTMLDTVPPKNFEMRLRLQARRSSEGAGGVAIRMTDRESYYALEIDAGRERIAFVRVAEGRSTEIVGVDSNITPDSWHTLAIRVEDGRFAVSLDGQWLFTAYDETLRQPGRVALWRERDSAMRFAPIVIEPLAATGEP